MPMQMVSQTSSRALSDRQTSSPRQPALDNLTSTTAHPGHVSSRRRGQTRQLYCPQDILRTSGIPGQAVRSGGSMHARWQLAHLPPAAASMASCRWHRLLRLSQTIVDRRSGDCLILTHGSRVPTITTAAAPNKASDLLSALSSDPRRQKKLAQPSERASRDFASSSGSDGRGMREDRSGGARERSDASRSGSDDWRSYNGDSQGDQWESRSEPSHGGRGGRGSSSSAYRGGRSSGRNGGRGSDRRSAGRYGASSRQDRFPAKRTYQDRPANPYPTPNAGAWPLPALLCTRLAADAGCVTVTAHVQTQLPTSPT